MKAKTVNSVVMSAIIAKLQELKADPTECVRVLKDTAVDLGYEPDALDDDLSYGLYRMEYWLNTLIDYLAD